MPGFGVTPRTLVTAADATAAGAAGSPEVEGVPVMSDAWPCAFASFLSSLRFFLSSRA